MTNQAVSKLPSFHERISMVSAVDRSGTNWLPYKSLNNVHPRLLVIGGIAAIMTGAGVMVKLRQRAGGKSILRIYAPRRAGLSATVKPFDMLI